MPFAPGERREAPGREGATVHVEQGDEHLVRLPEGNAMVALPCRAEDLSQAEGAQSGSRLRAVEALRRHLADALEDLLGRGRVPELEERLGKAIERVVRQRAARMRVGDGRERERRLAVVADPV